MRITTIGGPTVVVELRGRRILVDPTFDPPGRRYRFGLGTSSTKTEGPAVDPSDLGRIDLVLLSHDHHADNLDDAGRAVLAAAGLVVTTRSGAKRLASPSVRGLAPGGGVVVDGADGPLEITATPCRHGPPLSRPLVGEVIGFALRPVGAARHDLWVTGDTVRCRAVRRVARDLDVDVAIVHAGGVRFGLTGPVTYSMTGAGAVRLIGDLEPRVAVPVHYDGWSHFRDGEQGLRAAIRVADPATRDRIRLLTHGTPPTSDTDSGSAHPGPPVPPDRRTHTHRKGHPSCRTSPDAPRSPPGPQH